MERVEEVGSTEQYRVCAGHGAYRVYAHQFPKRVAESIAAAFAEIDRLTAENSVLKKGKMISDNVQIDIIKKYQSLTAENDTLRKLLKSLEWVGNNEESWCPKCGVLEGDNHAPDCELAEAVKGEK